MKKISFALPALLALSFLLSGCATESTTEPAMETSVQPQSETVVETPAEAAPQQKMSPEKIAGKSMELTGTISDTPWQHMIDAPRGYENANYVDFADGDQMVVYSKTPMECEGDVNIKGRYVEIEGTSKRPGSDESYTELQIMADEFECAD